MMHELALLAETTVVTSSDFNSVISAMTSQLSVSTVVEVLAYAIPVCIGLVFMWWGVRKVAGMLMRAFKRGKLRI